MVRHAFLQVQSGELSVNVQKINITAKREILQVNTGPGGASGRAGNEKISAAWENKLL